MTKTRTPKTSEVTIMLARIDTLCEVANPGAYRADLGERPTWRERPIATALCWLKKGTAEDIAKARAYAEREGYSVFTYALTERDPMKRAKADVCSGK